LPSSPTNARLAIAQIQMHWDVSENVQAMKQALRVAAADGAAICAFSELAVTGFHRRIVEWAKPEVSSPAVDEVRAAAASLGIAATFGAPTFDIDGQRFNSHLFVDASGAVAGTVSKVGLTDPEATFFAKGLARPTLRLGGLSCSAVICREIEDREQVLASLMIPGPQVVFWPGQMRPDPALSPQYPPRHVVQAQELARELGSYFVQTNWPNALNRPEESEGTGRSACISPSGELLFRLPEQGYGVAVFNLGDRAFAWHASGA
jgi:omega-amidase